MQFSSIFTAVMMLATAAAPAFAAPEAIPELMDRQITVTCHPGEHLIGAGCAPSQRRWSSCSADKRKVVACLGSGPTWQLVNDCQRGFCNNRCTCV